MLLVNGEPPVSQSGGLYMGCSGEALDWRRPRATRRSPLSIFPTYNSLIASCEISDSCAVTEELAFGHVSKSRAPIFCSIDISGILAVLDMRAPAPMSVLYVDASKTAESMASAIPKPRKLGLK